MDTSLLATKLRIPPQSDRIVFRARLVDALERSLPDARLVLLTAPAGYGKSTLLAQWADASRFPVVWLTIDDAENSLEPFFRSLLKALEVVWPDLGESPFGLLVGASESESTAVAPAFIEFAAEQSGHTVVVLDDAQLLTDSSTQQALRFLIDHLPPSLHFIIASRTEPSLPLARYRARQQLFEIHAEDLRFLADETSAFMTLQLGFALPDEEIAALQSGLEGWAAGLQLLSLTWGRRQVPARELVVDGRHRFIADYLREEVLAPLPEEIRTFLLQTCILDHLSGSLCDAVTGRSDGQEMLESLERDNLFLFPLDDRREWYRYHQLFADCLRHELQRHDPDDVAALHRRAARWCLDHQLLERVIPHAVAGNDPELAVRFGERQFKIKLLSGDYATLRRWIDALPNEWQRAYPQIGLIRTGLLLFTGALEAGVHCLDRVEQQIMNHERADRTVQLARVLAVRCAIACFQNDISLAETFAEQAFQGLSPEDHIYRTAILHALGDTYRRNGRWDEAKANYLAVLDHTREPAFRIRSAHVYCALADLEMMKGRLNPSAAYWRKALAIIEDQSTWGSFPLLLTGWVFIRWSELLYERNELSEARDFVVKGLERAELGGDVRAIIAGQLLVVRLSLLTGDLASASTLIETTRPLVEAANFPDVSSHFERLQLELWLAQGRLRAAVDWADAKLTGSALGVDPDLDITARSVARMLILKGDPASREQAITILKQLIARVEAEDRRGDLIEALALTALVVWSNGDRAEAMTVLERALSIAAPEGYIRTFADFGLPMARLLQEARARQVMPEYVGKLLAACGADLPMSSHGTSMLPEPLSPREQEVLKLIAAGLSNSEIADTLVVSPETVKKHAGNIFSKLGVHHRTEAVARARTLHLIE